MDKQQRTIVILLTTLAVIIGISAVLSQLFDTSKELDSITTWTPERWTAAPRTVQPATQEPTFTASPILETPTLTSTPKRGSCVYPAVYWLAYPDLWPSQIVFKGFRFTKETALSILLSPAQEENTTLLREFIVANLNIYVGANPSELGLVLEYAEEWLNLHPVGREVSEDDRQVGSALVVELKKFNNGELGPSQCNFALPPTHTPTATATATKTRIYIPPNWTATESNSSSKPPAEPTKPPPKPTEPPPKPTEPPPKPTERPTATPAP